MDASLDDKVVEARARLARVGKRDPQPVDENEVVLLSFRVPRSLRDEVHRAAVARGSSSQAWLSAVVGEATQASLTPEGRLATELARNLRSRLLEAVDDGSYRELVLADQEPDLA